MREIERKRELLEQVSPKTTLINEQKLSTKSSLGYYIPPNSMQFTKIYKSNTITCYYMGRNKKELKKSNVEDNFAGVAKFCSPCEIRY